MMWPIFWPNDTNFTNPANTRHPSEDVAAAAKYIGEQVAAVVAARRDLRRPAVMADRGRDLFPDVLPYVVGTTASYGFAGFNGRPGRQRPRSHAVPGHRHRYALRAQALRRRGPAGSSFPYVVPA